MTIHLIQATDKDLELLTEIMTAAFDYDTEIYFGKGRTGGPPGYDDGTLATRILKNERFNVTLIQQYDVTCGLIVYEVDQKNTIHYFCILPHYINQGIGTETWKQIVINYPKQAWIVETPDYSLRNHHFYQK